MIADSTRKTCKLPPSEDTRSPADPCSRGRAARLPVAAPPTVDSGLRRFSLERHDAVSKPVVPARVHRIPPADTCGREVFQRYRLAGQRLHRNAAEPDPQIQDAVRHGAFLKQLDDVGRRATVELF